MLEKSAAHEPVSCAGGYPPKSASLVSDEASAPLWHARIWRRAGPLGTTFRCGAEAHGAGHRFCRLRPHFWATPRSDLWRALPKHLLCIGGQSYRAGRSLAKRRLYSVGQLDGNRACVFGDWKSRPAPPPFERLSRCLQDSAELGRRGQSGVRAAPAHSADDPRELALCASRVGPHPAAPPMLAGGPGELGRWPAGGAASRRRPADQK